MIISLSGAPGSGKSTIAKLLAKELGWPRYYMGELRRAAAKKRGMSLAEYNRLGEKDPQTDLEVDKYQEELGKREDNFVIEGRTSWHFIPHSLKLYLDVNERVGAERIFQDLQSNPEKRNEGMGLNTIEEVLKSNKERISSDKKRYKKYFNIDAYDPNNYDFYLDTSNLNIEEVFNKVLSFIKNNIKN